MNLMTMNQLRATAKNQRARAVLTRRQVQLKHLRKRRTSLSVVRVTRVKIMKMSQKRRMMMMKIVDLMSPLQRNLMNILIQDLKVKKLLMRSTVANQNQKKKTQKKRSLKLKRITKSLKCMSQVTILILTIFFCAQISQLLGFSDFSSILNFLKQILTLLQGQRDTSNFSKGSHEDLQNSSIGCR